MHDQSTEPGLLPQDALSEILRDLRIQGVAYGHCRMRRPWGVDIPSDGFARLHLVVSGESWLCLQGGELLRLEAGDAVLLPHGSAHAISDEPGRPTTPLNDLPRRRIGERTYHLEAGGDGNETILSCCTIDFDEPAVSPLRDLMPALLVIRNAAFRDTLIPSLIDALAQEVLSPRMGSATVMAKLADIIVTRTFRSWAENATTAEKRGWLSAVRDPHIGRALSAFHRSPEDVWTIERLAATANMSRSVFCDRFSSVVGLTPSRYVARWRMRLASIWLKTERCTIAQVSGRLGYESEAAFSRAFKRMTGHPPSILRRRTELPDQALRIV